MALASQIQGIIPPLATPFAADGEFDLDALRAKVRMALGCGVHGLTVASITGEGMRLEREVAPLDLPAFVPPTAVCCRSGAHSDTPGRSTEVASRLLLVLSYQSQPRRAPKGGVFRE